MTQAYLHPEHFSSATTFVHDYLRGATDDVGLTGGSGRQAIFIGKAFSARLALLWVIIAFGLSVAIGCAAGSVRGDSAYGLNIGFGMLALLGWTQMVLAWQIRS
jgi:hypothetical protein